QKRCRTKWYTYEMNRVLKTFMLWLLLAALPLQGFAAAIQTSCGPMAHHGPFEMVMEAQRHHHEGDGAASPSTVAAAKSSGISADTKHKSAFCDACTACCVGAVALPSDSVLTAVYSNSLPVVSAPTPLVSGFIPAGLERPPKRITA
ncbi:MAG: hypothetical protein ACJ8G3_08050, partial [Burkholderiaceae bacterium]